MVFTRRQLKQFVGRMIDAFRQICGQLNNSSIQKCSHAGSVTFWRSGTDKLATDGLIRR
jgi:hypothetical protein